MANMKFYMTPGSCSTGIHILLEELGLIFDVYIVNLPAGDQHTPDYVAINPKSTIPTLVKPDGGAITEFCAIAYWLARSYPDAGLMPGNVEGDTLVLESMSYIVSTVHMQGFARIFTTNNYTFSESDAERVKAQGETIVRRGFGIINKQLMDRPYIAGEYSVADAALFYCEFWAVRIGIELPQRCQTHYQRMLQRPAIRQVLMEEGYSSLFQ